MKIMHNMRAMNANRNRTTNTNALSKSLKKLSSGYKINNAADDAAGLAISEGMRMLIAGLEQGENNVNDGVSLVQTADGALHEVNSMLHRMRELATQSANGTYTDTERQHMQEEVDQLVQEIDRITKTTNFNGIPLFQGNETVIRDADGNPISNSSIGFEDVSLVSTQLNMDPFGGSTDPNHLEFRAIVTSSDQALANAVGGSYNLIYGSGSTSHSSVRLNGTDVVPLDNFTYINTYKDPINPIFMRMFQYTDPDSGIDITLSQNIVIRETADKKFYDITYEFNNNSNTAVDIEFMFHADTAYNNNDRCEGYFSGGQKITTTGTYANTNGGCLGGNGTNSSSPGSLTSISIVDEDKALNFTEYIDFGNAPDVSIGYYNSIHDWDYNMHPAQQNTNDMDLGFSLLWKIPLQNNSSTSVNFDYGIVKTTADTNIDPSTITMDTSPFTQHSAKKDIWIQASATAEDGMHIYINELSCRLLGIDPTDISSVEASAESIKKCAGALDKVLSTLAELGAQQNRLEHTFANNGVTKENLIASESRIRDTDMAKEMMQYTKSNILNQASQSMLAQANTSAQGILQLLQ